MKTKSKWLPLIILGVVLLVILGLIFMFKDPVLLQIDFLTRKKACMAAYNNRTVFTEETKDAEGYSGNERIKMKLENVKFERNVLSFDIKLKTPSSDLLKTEKLIALPGIIITDNNNTVYVAKENVTMLSLIEENKCDIFSKPRFAEESICIYLTALAEELKKDYIPDDLILENTFHHLRDVSNGTIHYEFRLKRSITNLNPETLNISVSELMLFDNTVKYDLDNPTFYEKFTEWKFVEKIK